MCHDPVSPMTPCGGMPDAGFAALMEAVSESVLLLDRDGRIQEVNRVGAERLDSTPGQLRGRSVFAVWPAEIVELRRGLFGEAVASGQPVSFSDQRDGRHFDLTYHPVRDAQGDVVQVIAFGREVTAERQLVTALRQAEAKYRGIVENAVEGIFQTSPDGRYLTANRALARMYGFDSVAQMIAELTDIGGQLYVDEGRREIFCRLLSEGDILCDFESEIRRRDGGRAWISEHARAVRDADGRVLFFEGTVQDITERKRAQMALQTLNAELEARIAERTASLAREVEERRRAEARLRRASQEAQAATHAKSAFLAQMSHELRTPLNAILGFSEVMREEMLGSLPPQYRDYAATIHGAGRHLLALINEVLDLAKIEAGRMELLEEEVTLPPLLEDCLALVRERAERAGIALTLDLPAQPPRLRGDLLRLKQIVLNLLSNAVKFTPAGGRVTVRAVLDDDGLALSVADTGRGIAPEDIATVLEPFSQADNSETAHEGTGLGLPLARQLVELHGGCLDIASALGTGTTVTIRLPRERVLG